MRVLVVEDDSKIASLVVNGLEQNGFARTVRKLEPCKNGPFLGKHFSVPLLRLDTTGSVARFKFYLPCDM